MNDQQFQEWLDQHGGEVGRKNNEKTVDGPADPNTGAPSKQTITDTTTVTARDGATITLRRNPGPINGGVDYEVVATEPPKATATTAATKEGDTRGPQTGPTREVYRGGQWVVEPNPVYQPPQGAKEWRTEGTPLPGGSHDNTRPIMVAYVNGRRTGETRQLTGAELKDWNEAGQRSRNPGGRTDAEIQAEADRNKPGAPTLKPDGKGGTVAVQMMPDGTIKMTPLPGVPSEATSRYTEVKQDPTTGAWHGFTKDGRWEQIQGGPGREPKAGQLVTVNGESFWAQPNPDPSKPPILTRASELPGAAEPKPPADNGPQMTPGQSPSAYLTQRRQWYIDQRRAGTMMQAQVNDAWERDKEIAQATQNEASLAATQQNQRLSSSMSGFNSAMSEIGTLNRYLPVGSDLGGRALEATLGLQYAQAQRMGGYGSQPAPLAIPPAPNEPDPSSQVAAIPPAPSPVATSEVGQPGDPTLAGNEAARQAAGANPAFRPMPPVDMQPATPPSQVTLRHRGTAMESQVPADFLDPANSNHPTNLGDFKVVPVSAIPESPYDFQARIASLPPWQMDEATWEEARRRGLEEDFWRVV